MKLLTKEIRGRLPRLRATEGDPIGERKVEVKFFTPWSNWTWYGLEGEPIRGIGPSGKEEEIDFRFFGLVDGLEAELGYFHLSELESVRGPFGLKVERDRYIGTPTLAEVAEEHSGVSDWLHMMERATA